MSEAEERYSRRRIARHDDEDNSDEWQIPEGGWGKALLIGLIAGLAGTLINIAITFLGSPLYQQAAHNTAASSIYLAVSGLACLGFIIQLVVCYIAGFNVGKQAVLHKFGFITGALAATVMFLCSFLVRYIPNYPGNLVVQSTTTVAAFSRGLIVSLVFLLIWLFIGGLLGLWGASRATRRHPYYTERAEGE